MALLLLYPLAVIGLRLIGTGRPSLPAAIKLNGDISTRDAGESLLAEVTLRAANPETKPVFVDTLILTAMEGDKPVLSLLVESRMMAGRWSGSPELAPGQEADLGSFHMDIPRSAPGGQLLVTLKVTRKEGSRTPLLAQCDLTIPPPSAP